MTWKAMTADRVGDLVDFWAGAEWPLTPEQVQQLGTKVGWTPGDDEMMDNQSDGLSESSVPIATMPSGETASFSFWATDVVRELGAEADAFLDDAYALIVRDGTGRWGRAAQSDGDGPTAQWDLDGGARVVVARGRRSVTVEFTAPQYAQVLRELGE